MSPRLILLVDDDRDTVEGYSVFLQARGHATATAADGLSAVAAALRLRPDLILLDLGLPRMNGLEVLRRIRADAEGATIPVIILTGHAYPEDVNVARQQLCSRVLIKPCDPMTLCEAVETTLQAHMQVERPPYGARSNGALRVRTPKPRRRARRPDVAPGERDLTSLCLWADFLCRHAAVLQDQARDLSTAAAAIRIRSRKLAARRAHAALVGLTPQPA
jgi:DNA-binding response OmpR family regulator